MQTLRAVDDMVYVTKAGSTEFVAGQVVELEEGHPLIAEFLGTGMFELVAETVERTTAVVGGAPKP